MKRTELARGPIRLTRRTPLARTAMARRPAQRPTEPSKPRPGSTDIPQAVRDTVAARSRGVCEAAISAVCLGPATNMHHRRRRNIPPAHTVPNLLHLCGSGTTGCHGWITEHPAASKHQEAGWIVPSTADPAGVPVRVRGRLVWLTENGRYVGEAQP